MAKRLVSAGEGDPAMTRMLLRRRDEHISTTAHARPHASSGKRYCRLWPAESRMGWCGAGPADLWMSVWLALVAFAAERVSAKEWPAEDPKVALTIEAAWDAISTAGKQVSG